MPPRRLIIQQDCMSRLKFLIEKCECQFLNDACLRQMVTNWLPAIKGMHTALRVVHGCRLGRRATRQRFANGVHHTGAALPPSGFVRPAGAPHLPRIQSCSGRSTWR